MSRRVVLKETLVYGVGTYLSQLLSAIRGMVIAGMLGPSLYGLWKVVQVGLDYLAYTHLGALHGMARQLPIAKKEGDTAGDRTFRSVALAFTWTSAVIGGLLTILVANLLDATPGIVWMGVAVLLIPVQLFRFLHMICLADGRFAVLSSANLLLASVSFAVMVLLVPTFQVMGVLAGLAAGYLAGILFGWLRGIYSHPPQWDYFKPGNSRKAIWSLLVVGFPFMTVDALFVVWQGVDRLALATVYGANTPSLGHYGLAAMIASFAIQLPQVITRVLFRRTVRTFGTGESVATLDMTEKRKYIDLPVQAVSGATPILFVLCAIASQALLPLALPEYIPAGPLIVVLLFAAYWTGVGLMVRHVYTGSNQQVRLGVFYAGAIVLTLGVIYADAFLGGGRLGPMAGAVGMLCASIVFALTALMDTARLMHYAKGATVRLLASAIWPAIPFALWAWFEGLAPHSTAGALDGDLLLWNTMIGIAWTAPSLAWTLWVLSRRRS